MPNSAAIHSRFYGQESSEVEAALKTVTNPRMKTFMTTEGKNAAAEEAITKEALTRYQATTGPRLREIILSLIKHLHGFARDVRLTGDEYLFAIDPSGPAGRLLQGRQAGVPHARRDARARNPGDPDIATEAGRRDAAGRARTVLPSERTSFRERCRHRRRRRGRASLRLGAYSRDRSSACSKRDHQRLAIGRAGDCTTCRVTWPRTECGTRGQLKSEPDGRYSLWTVVPIGYPVPNDGGMGRPGQVYLERGLAAGARSLHDQGRWPRHPGDANLRARQ